MRGSDRATAVLHSLDKKNRELCGWKKPQLGRGRKRESLSPSLASLPAKRAGKKNEPASDGQLSKRSRNDVESQTPANHGAGSTWYVLALSFAVLSSTGFFKTKLFFVANSIIFYFVRVMCVLISLFPMNRKAALSIAGSRSHRHYRIWQVILKEYS